MPLLINHGNRRRFRLKRGIPPSEATPQPASAYEPPGQRPHDEVPLSQAIGNRVLACRRHQGVPTAAMILLVPGRPHAGSD